MSSSARLSHTCLAPTWAAGIAGAVPVQVGAAGAPAPPVVFGDGGLEDLGAVGPRHPLLAPPDRQLPAHVGLHGQRRHAQLEGLGVQGAACAGGKAGPVQEDARVLVFAGAVHVLAVMLVEFQVALAAQALFAELPVVVGEPAHGVVEPGAVVVVGEERAVRAAPVVGATRHRALAGRRAENTGPARQQPGEVGRDQVLGIVRVVELHPLAGEVQLDLLTGLRVRIRHGVNVRPRSAPPHPTTPAGRDAGARHADPRRPD